MNENLARLCELQADVFEKSSSFTCGSKYFMFRFFQSEVAKRIDEAGPAIPLPSAQEAIESLLEEYPSLNERGGKKLSSPLLRWIGYVTRAYSSLTHCPSFRLLKEIPIEKLVSLYDVYHTFDVEYAVERLKEIALDNRGQETEITLLRKAYGI